MIGLCKSDDVFRTRSRIMKIPDGYRTIEKTGIVRSLSLLRSSFSLTLSFSFSFALSRILSIFTGSLTLVDAQKWPVPAPGRRGIHPVRRY